MSEPRYIIFRTRTGNLMNQAIAKVGKLVNGKVYTHNGIGGHGIKWYHRGVPLERLDYVREATPREVALGMSIH